MKNTRKRTILRWGIILFWVLLFLQFAFSNFDEPYPGILFPTFAGIYNTGNEVKFSRYKVYAFTSNKDSLEVSEARLFDPIGAVFRPGILKNLERRKKGVQKSKAFNIGLFKCQFNMQLRSDSLGEVKFSDWMKNNMNNGSNPGNFTRIKFFNYDYTYNLKQDEVTSRHLKGQFVIFLKP